MIENQSDGVVVTGDHAGPAFFVVIQSQSDTTARLDAGEASRTDSRDSVRGLHLRPYRRCPRNRLCDRLSGRILIVLHERRIAGGRPGHDADGSLIPSNSYPTVVAPTGTGARSKRSRPQLAAVRSWRHWLGRFLPVVLAFSLVRLLSCGFHHVRISVRIVGTVSVVILRCSHAPPFS